MKLSKREIILLIILIITAIGYIFHTYTYIPLREKIDKLVLENAGLEKTIKAEQEAIAALLQIDEEQQNHNYKLLAEKVPEAPFLPEIVAYLDKNARDCSLDLLAVNYKEASRENIKKQESNAEGEVSDPGCLELHATVCGSYHGLILFLTKIERADRIYALENTRYKLSKKQIGNSPTEIIYDADPSQEYILADTTSLAGYNPDQIIMEVKFKAYYDNRTMAGISGTAEKVEPGQGVEDPFRR